MISHLTEEQVELYRARSLAAAELIGVSQHIAECEACRARIGSPGELYTGVEAFRAVLEGEAAVAEHLTYHEIAAYVDKQITGEDAAEIEKHARQCQSCAADIAEIEALKREIAPSPRSGWFARLWEETFTWKGAFALAGAAACAAFVLVMVRKPVQESPREQASVQRPQPTPTAGIRDGPRVIAIAPGGTVTGLEDLPVSLQATLAQAITAQQIEAPAAMADLTGKRSVLLGASAPSSGVDLLAPVGIVVEAQKPVFRWEPAAGAEYRVSVYSDSYDEIAASAWLQKSEWQITRTLQRGARYSWQVNVRRNGKEFTVPTPPAPEARFRILGAAEEAEITQLKAGRDDAHLVVGIGYAQMGALDDAERELRKASEQNPGSVTVSALLASVERMRDPKP